MALQDSYYAGQSGMYTFYGTTGIWMAQTFKASSSYTIGSVELQLYRVGSPGTLTVSINTVDGSTPPQPTSTILTSGTYSGNDLGTTPPGVFVPISLTPYALTSGVTYAIVIHCAGDVNNRATWAADIDASNYAGGQKFSSTNGGGTWTGASTMDFMFKTYSAVDVVSIEGVIAGVSVWGGSVGVLEFIHIEGNIAGVGSWVGDSTLTGTITLVWPPTRPAVIADDDTLHNNTLIAVGFDANGIGIIYFKET